jgi:hypothetical protein
MNKKYVGVAGGIVIAVSMFLPLINLLGVSMTMFKSSSGVAIFFIASGLVISWISLTSRRWLNILSVLFGLIVCMLAMKYYSDANNSGAGIGVGIWVMLIGGMFSIVGAIMGLLPKKVAA